MKARYRYPIWPLPENLLLLALTTLLCSSRWSGAFAYEFSFFLGLAVHLTAATGVALRLSRLKVFRPLTPSDLFRAWGSNLLTLVLPLILVLLFTLKNPTCRYDVGLAWFLLLPVTTSLFGAACAIWASGVGQRRPSILFWTLLPTLLFSALTVVDLWIGPGLSFLNPGWGYFSGPLYEEWIPITSSIVTYRVWTVGLSIWMIGASHLQLRGREPLRHLGWVASGIAIFFVFVARQPLGWHHGPDALEQTLNSRITGSQITLHFRSGQNLDRKERFLFRVLEGRVKKLVTELQLDPIGFLPVDIYIYPSASIKKKLTGTAYINFGNPIRRSVHLLFFDPFDSIYVHELTHVLAAEFGLPGIGLSPRVGLLEGLATAMEQQRSRLSVHEWAHAMLKLDKLPPISQLMKFTGFFGQPPSRAYLAAGSFCRWLIDRYGIQKFKQIYRGTRFSQVYGTPVESLAQSWRRFLSSVSLSKETISLAEHHFQQRSIFEKRCPHDVAGAVQAGWSCWRSSDFSGAGIHFEKALDYAGSTPTEVLRLARAKTKQRKWDRVYRLVEPITKNENVSSTDQARAALFQGDSLFHLDRKDEVEMAYLHANLSEVGIGLRIELGTRLFFASNQWWPGLALVTEAKHDELFKKASDYKHWPTSVRYWVARRYARSGDLDSAFSIVNQKIASTDPLFPTWTRLRARLSERRGGRREALVAYQELIKAAQFAGERLSAQTEIDRLTFSP